ncbi:c-type cytochrome domain-containing protein [Lewinella sp. 4G2]|uniref:c-type cytochrome domain-containing protein n=1 Tax=Lewinella sp. 4G2 TaxID=1803372 RepID=UPI0018D27576|nr:c-type cytochrome domain-containing protein [Lewinella sp. 4G2]
MSLFFGRFHPLVVHLPIGFLLLAAVLEWWPGSKARPAIRVAWVLGAASAVAAALFGWLLAEESGGGDTLFWHRWLGISVAVLAVAGVFLTHKGGKLAKGYGIVVAGLLGLAGHQGGNLTHGEEYLFQHAPPIVQRIAGHEGEAETIRDWETVNTDSINLYHTFLQPAITETCAKCHNDQKQNGGLRMDEPHFAFLGGDTGPLFVPGNAFGSLWTKRVTLPSSNAKAMPPQGDPWDYTEIELLKYWIDQGADTLFTFDPRDTPESIKLLLQRDYGLDLRPRLFVETITAPALSAQEMEELAGLEWSLSSLQPKGGALEAKVQPGKSTSPKAISELARVAADQVVYLSLDRMPVTDADLLPLRQFQNLNRLRLNGTQVTGSTVEQLKELQHLESLNLYGTQVKDDIFTHLADYPKLKRVYLWQTGVSPAAVEAFTAAHPSIAVNTGYQPVAAPTSK